jgi:multidrug efflux pump subunit AcrA (membrane-fusion protein)
MSVLKKVMHIGLPVLAVVLGVTGIVMVGVATPDVSARAADAVPPETTLQGERVAGAGLVEPSSELVQVAPQVAGVIREVLVRPGDRVDVEAPLFRLDDRTAAAELGQRRAQLASAMAAAAEADVQRRQAALELERYRAISLADAMVREELDRRRFAVESADALLRTRRGQVEEAQAGVVVAETALAHTVIRAPMAATVLQVRARPGEFASAGAGADVLVTLGVTRPLHVRIDVDEADIARIDLDGEGEVVSRGEFGLRSAVRMVRVEPLVVPKTSLTNSAAERVDTRVLQVVYVIPEDGAARYFVGQQVDAFLPAKREP